MRIKLRDEAVEYLALRDVEPRPELKTGRTWGLAFVPESNRLASLREAGPGVASQELTLWDVADGQVKNRFSLGGGRFEGPSEFAPLRFGRAGSGLAAAGRTLAVVRPDGQGLHLLSAAAGTPIAEMVTPGRYIDSVAASPADGRRLVTVERVSIRPARGRAVLWNTDHPDQPIATLLDPAPVEDRSRRDFQWPLVAFSPDGALIATAWQFSGGPEEVGPIITLWDAEDGSIVGEIGDLPAAIQALTLGPDGLVAAAISDGTIRLWDGADLTPRTGLNHAQNFVRALRFSPDGTMLAVAGSGTGIELWDPGANTLVAIVGTRDRVSDLAFSSDGQTLAASCGESTCLWAIFEPVGRVRLSSFEGRPTSLAFGHDDTLAIASWGGDGPRVWHPGQCPTTARSLGASHATAIAFDDQGLVVTADGEGLSWINADTAEPVAHLSFDANRRPSPSFWPSLVAGVGVAQTAPAEALRRRTGSRRGGFLILPIDAVDQGHALALSRFNQVFLWSAQEPDLLQPLIPPDRAAFPGRPGPTRGGRPGRAMIPPWIDLTLAPDRNRLYLISTENELHAWSIEHRDGTYKAHALPWSATYHDATTLALFPDGRTLAVGTTTGAVHLIDTARGTVRGTLGPETEAEPDGPVASLALAPDGQTLAIGTAQGRITLWSLAGSSHAELLLHLPGHRGEVSPLAFSRDGRLLASAGDGKVVQVWDLQQVRERLLLLGLGW